ncbi:DUF4349 domain-containing protein [Crassaminicella indica]|uniref:DUF4349 domain-containing protein n=1 Tax=Crassaminicella indica TaxID=2855394 RepID=A0ABX8RA95_9CLOT|nr:DUF4349 domain-containing protein [Crassaminicella indica]QXM05731.1 DUF4349 domain-containing protein [Crassaminicella indica]
MRCMEMEEMISLYIDDILDKHTKDMLDKHLKECKECRSEYENLMRQIDLCNKLPMVDLPEGFEDDLHEALLKVNEENETLDKKINVESISLKKKNKKFSWKVFSSIAAVFIILIISISTLSSMNMGKKEEIIKGSKENIMEIKQSIDGFATPNKNEVALDNSEFRGNNAKSIKTLRGSSKINTVSEKQVIKSNERKIIKSAYVELDIENYDKKFNEIINMTEAMGGYIEDSNTAYSHYVPEKVETSLKKGNITVRVPEDNFISMVEKVKELGTVTNFSINGQDITQMYRDTANEIENLKIQEKRLREIMKKANNVKDVLEVERELTRVRGELNRLTGNIKRWDNLVSLSSIHISLNEIIHKDKKIQQVDHYILDKAKKGWISTVNHIVDFFEKSFVLFVSILPIILLIGVIGIPIIYVIKKLQNK